jgi:hypothetical protein
MPLCENYYLNLQVKNLATAVLSRFWVYAMRAGKRAIWLFD